ncbi:MAG: homoserine O-acetyltransferase [Bacillota bacterium]|nr:homoserine O-acetyltransferase [Bacillota bacterium]
MTWTRPSGRRYKPIAADPGPTPVPTPAPTPVPVPWDRAPNAEFELCELGAERVELDLGGHLEGVAVAYETYGRLNSVRDNVVLVCHALTADSHVARHDGGQHSAAGWWEGMVGPGLWIDTGRYFVVCANVLGGCRGTTGPRSADPSTGVRYGPRFPTITVRDMVRVQHRLLERLGVRSVACVVGGSLGGMQALEWAIMYPEMVRRSAVIAAPGKVTAQAIALNEVQRQAILRDPAWQGGEYEEGAGPAAGLGLARMIAMITYQSEESMQRKFGRTAPALADEALALRRGFEVENYLHHQGEKLVSRFDANSYVCLLRAMDLFDPARGYGSQDEALARIRAKVLVVGVSSDILYPVHHQWELATALTRLGKSVRSEGLFSPWGHDSFLIEIDGLGKILTPFLES